MKTINLHVNGRKLKVDVDPETPLLWVLRDTLRLTGTKFGCGLGVCGACTIHINGDAVRACTIAVAEVEKAKITTIEGLSKTGEHPVQRAWLAEEVAQCGYCQPGQIMQACVLLAKNKKPTDAQIDEAMKDNICRCGTYQRIRKAIRRAANKM